MMKKDEPAIIAAQATSATNASVATTLPGRTKLSFRVSGARVGESVRPASDVPAIAAAPRFGLRVHRTIPAIAPCKASMIAPEDYATADEDYT